MGTTARGLVYPELTDDVDVPADIQAAMASVEAMISGTGTNALDPGDVDVVGGARVQGEYVPASGMGVEIGWTGAVGVVQAQGRAPNAYKPMHVGGTTVSLDASGTTRVTATALGADVTGDLTVSDDLTVAGDVAMAGAGVSPYFTAYRAAASSLATGAAVVFDTETDPNGWFATGTGIFTPTVAGTYRLSWAVTITTVLTADNWFSADLSALGATPAQGSVSFQRGGSKGLTSVGSILLPFNGSTDNAKIVVAHNNGGNVALDVGQRHTHFEAERVGA